MHGPDSTTIARCETLVNFLPRRSSLDYDLRHLIFVCLFRVYSFLLFCFLVCISNVQYLAADAPGLSILCAASD